jgi:P27 family predicted phage terminase small subunit
MKNNVISGPGADIAEPKWTLLIPDVPGSDPKANSVAADWRDVAHQEWLRVTTALRETGTLAPENRHQIQRLILAYVRFDKAAAQVMREGAVVQSKKKVSMLNIWQTEMRAADSDATTAEMELGITPRRRGAVTKARGKAKQASKADGYINAAKKG